MELSEAFNNIGALLGHDQPGGGEPAPEAEGDQGEGQEREQDRQPKAKPKPKARRDRDDRLPEKSANDNEESDDDEEDERKARKPKPKGKPKPKAKTPDPEPDDEDDDEDQDDDSDGDEDDDAEPEKPSTVRKFRRYGQEHEIDTAAADALDRLLAMLDDDHEVSLKVNGGDFVSRQGDLPSMAQKAAAANQLFANANKMVTDFRGLVQSFQGDPAGLLRNIQVGSLAEDEDRVADLLHAVGIDDHIEWAARVAKRHLDVMRQGMDPNDESFDPNKYIQAQLQRQQRGAQFRREQEQRREMLQRQQQEQAQAQEQQREQLNRYAQSLPKAFERAGLANSELARKVSWDLYMQSAQQGYLPSPDELAVDTRKALQQLVTGHMGGFDPGGFRKFVGDDRLRGVVAAMVPNPESLVEFLGPDVVKALRKFDTKRAKAKAAGAKRSGVAAPAEGSSDRGGPVHFSDLIKQYS